MLYVLKKKKIIRKIEQCHKLLVVLVGGLAPTRSYSERWQVARIGLCCHGAVCGALKIVQSSKFMCIALLGYHVQNKHITMVVLSTCRKIRV